MSHSLSAQLFSFQIENVYTNRDETDLISHKKTFRWIFRISHSLFRLLLSVPPSSTTTSRDRTPSLPPTVSSSFSHRFIDFTAAEGESIMCKCVERYIRRGWPAGVETDRGRDWERYTIKTTAKLLYLFQRHICFPPLMSQVGVRGIGEIISRQSLLKDTRKVRIHSDRWQNNLLLVSGMEIQMCQGWRAAYKLSQTTG